jgi:hypothetical protein
MLLRAEPLLEAQRHRFVKRTMAGISVAVVGFGASAWPVTAAGADPVTATRAEISAVQGQIAAGATQVHAFTLAFTQANLTAQTIGQQVQADQARIAQLQTRLRGSETVLRREALLSYTGAASNDQPVGTGDPSVRAEYLQVATGNLNDDMDEFRATERQVATAEATLVHQQRLSQAAARAAAAARQEALAAAESEQSRLDQLQAQLSQFVQAAAVAADQRAAAAAAASAAAAAAARATATQGLPVDNGLVSAVHTMVSAPPPAPAPAAPVASGSGGAGGVWLQLRECESSDNYAANTGNGYYGVYQFSEATWAGLGYPGRPDQEPPALQDQAAMTLQARAGWGQWPACAAALGLR